jgi:hypothetical protein
MICSNGFNNRPSQTVATNHRSIGAVGWLQNNLWWLASCSYKSIFRNHEKVAKKYKFF